MTGAVSIVAAIAGVIVLYSNFGVVFGAASPLGQAVSASSWLLLGMPVMYHVLIRKRVPRVDAVFGLMVLLLMMQLTSSLVAVDMGVALRSILQYATEGLVTYWLIINVVRSRRDLHWLMAAAMVTCAVLASMSLYQAGTGDYDQQFSGLARRELPEEVTVAAEDDEEAGAIRAREMGLQTADRAAGPIGDPNRYAQILLVVLPWCLYFMRRSPSPTLRFTSLASAMLILAAVALTYSRGAFLTMGVMTVCLVLWGLIKPTRLVLAGVVLSVVALIAAPNMVARITSIGSVSALGDETAGVTPDGAIRGRATEMLAGLAVFLDHPFLGVGPDQYVLFYSERYQSIEDLSFRDLPRPRESHNLYVSVAAELGAPGLLLLLAIVFSLLLALRTERLAWRQASPSRADLATVLTLSLVSYLGTGMFLHLSFERYLWFLVGIASATVFVLRQDRSWVQAEDARVDTPKPGWPWPVPAR